MKEQELNTLKKKSPSDLWKEDLAVFIEELEVCVYKIYIILIILTLILILILTN